MKAHVPNAARLRAFKKKSPYLADIDEDCRNVRFVERWCYCAACRRRRWLTNHYAAWTSDHYSERRVTRPQLQRMAKAHPELFDAIAENK